jgi:YD repeat-containing protein
MTFRNLRYVAGFCLAARLMSPPVASGEPETTDYVTNADGDLVYVADSDGNELTFVRDADGNIIATVDQDGVVTDWAALAAAAGGDGE